MPFSVQCWVPRRAFDALDPEAIRAAATLAGVERARWEYSTVKIPSFAPPSSGHLTCSIPMAVIFVEAFRVLAAEAGRKHDTDLLIAIALAVKALLDGIEEATRPPTGSGPTPY